jgi:TetR/AcrR family transcriptional repressor of nem operon
MASKSERTKQFIIETVAPVFNKFGYIGTSMSEITKVTGLTKGAVYGNFKNKEELAVEAFNYNLKKVMGAIALKTAEVDSPTAKLKAIIDFYRHYHDFTIPFGGCPILNLAVDANHQNSLLLERAVAVIKKLQGRIEEIIEAGIVAGEFRAEVDSKKHTRRVFSLIEGSIFMTMTMKDSQYILDMADMVDEIIDRELIAN